MARARLRDYVVYVVSVASVKCKCDTPDQAKDFAVQEIMSRLATADSNVHIPKVAVMETGVDEEVKEHLAEAQAPWMNEGSGIEPNPDLKVKIEPFEDPGAGGGE